MNFGNVSLKLLVSVTLLTGCVSEQPSSYNLYLKYQQYENRVGFCLSEARKEDYPFLRSQWLHSLNESTQKQVIIYLSSLIMEECSTKEKEEFMLALRDETDDVQKIITESLHLDLPIKSKPVGVDEAQLNALTSQITAPFSAFHAFETLKKLQDK